MTDYEYILAQCWKRDSAAWTEEFVNGIKAVPTVKLAEIMYRNIESYEWNLAMMDWAEFSHFYKDVYENARDELRERYVSGVDRKAIESAFNHSSYENKEWLKWQKRKEKVAVVRYKNPLQEKIRSCEVFADREFVEGNNPLALSFDLVIRIKDKRHFFHHGDGRLDAVMDLFREKSEFSIQYVGIGKDIWLGVADEKSIGIDDDE